jgi:ArsR family metal-binding transcriptional regulator
MTIDQISQLIGQVGFPIFVAGYMLMKQNKDTENMTNILTQLQSAINHLADKLEK